MDASDIDTSHPDAGQESGADASTPDASTADASVDASLDALADAVGPDATDDSASEAGTDAANDAGADAPDGSLACATLAAGGTSPTLTCTQLADFAPPSCRVALNQSDYKICAITVNTPTQATYWLPVVIASFREQSVSLRTSCDDATSDILCMSAEGTWTHLLQPGTTYYIAYSHSPLWFPGDNLVFEPPPPPASNAGCATPLPLQPGVPYLEPRITDGNPTATRSYQITVPTAAMLYFSIAVVNSYGFTSLTLSTACSGGTVLGTVDSDYGTHPGSATVSVQAGTYYLVATAGNGIQYQVNAGY
jgi:hypothetical protein